LTDISKADNPHYAYTDPDSAESYLTALDQLEAYISRDGGFDGILAFSQGAGLAIQYMARKRIEGTRPLKCAILFAPTGVGDVFAWNERREKRLLKQLPNGEKIGVPVALIWGAQDEWRDMFEKDMQLFEEKNLWGFEHEGGHEIPGLNMKTSFRGVVKVVRRAITQAVLESG
jgi:dienelactone hydrolase